MDSTLLCLAVAVVLIVGVLVAMGNAQAAAQKRIAAAHDAYQAALAALKAKPTDAGLRQAALDAGRSYAELARQDKGRTMFDLEGV
jgi:predicted negative regulator of RcsB-dependent stress response